MRYTATQVSIKPQNAVDFDINSVFLFQLLCDEKPFGIIPLKPGPNDFYVPRRRRSNLALKMKISAQFLVSGKRPSVEELKLLRLRNLFSENNQISFNSV